MHEIFHNFLDSFKTESNTAIIESSQAGFSVLFEDMTSYYNNYWKKKIPNKDIFNTIVAADPTSKPTKKGMFTQWLLERYMKGEFHAEDAGMIRESFNYYLKNRKKFKEEEKITKIEDFETMPNFMEKTYIESEATKNLRSKAEREHTVLHDGSDWKLVVPHSMEAAIYFGRDSGWCTANPSPSLNHFEGWNSNGKQIYIFLDKKKSNPEYPHGKAKYQFEIKDYYHKGRFNSDVENIYELGLSNEVLSKYENMVIDRIKEDPKLFKQVPKHMRGIIDKMSDSLQKKLAIANAFNYNIIFTHIKNKGLGEEKSWQKEINSMLEKAIEKSPSMYLTAPDEFKKNRPQLGVKVTTKDHNLYKAIPIEVKEKLPVLAKLVSYSNPKNYEYVPKSIKEKLSLDVHKHVVTNEPLNYTVLPANVKNASTELAEELALLAMKEDIITYSGVPVKVREKSIKVAELGMKKNELYYDDIPMKFKKRYPDFNRKIIQSTIKKINEAKSKREFRGIWNSIADALQYHPMVLKAALLKNPRILSDFYYTEIKKYVSADMLKGAISRDPDGVLFYMDDSRMDNSQMGIILKKLPSWLPKFLREYYDEKLYKHPKEYLNIPEIAKEYISPKVVKYVLLNTDIDEWYISDEYQRNHPEIGLLLANRETKKSKREEKFMHGEKDFKKDKFLKFMDKMELENVASLSEAIRRGYKACFYEKKD